MTNTMPGWLHVLLHAVFALYQQAGVQREKLLKQ
jgi:hypothetical protein